MADLSKILQQESEGIMFPFRTGVQSTTTEQQVYDSATDGIMTVTGEQYTLPEYKGPTATVQYGTEEEGYPRMLREIEQGELPQFQQETFPAVGEGVMTPSVPTTQPVETAPAPEPTVPTTDPCPPGYQLVNGVCQPIQRDRGERKPDEIDFGPGKTPFQNIEFANNILFEGNEQFNYYKDSDIINVKTMGGGIRTPEAEADLQTYFNQTGADQNASKLDDSAFFAYLDSSGLKDKYGSTSATFNLSKIPGKSARVGEYTIPALGVLMSFAEKDMVKGAINTYNNAGLTTGITVDGKMYQAGTAEYNTALKNALDNDADFTLNFDTPKLNTFNKNFGQINSQILAENKLMRELSQLPKALVESTIAKLAMSGSSISPIRGKTRQQLIAYANPREDIHKKTLGVFDTYSPKAKKQIVEAKHSDENLSEDTKRVIRDTDNKYNVNTRELSKREHNNKNSYASKNKETADETAKRIAKNIEEDPMRQRTGVSAFSNEDTKKSISSGNDSKNEKKIVCTMMNESYGFGSFRNKIWLAHSSTLSKEYEVGYHTLFLPLVRYAKQKGFTNTIVKKILEHIARHRTLDIRKQKYNKVNILGRVYRTILEPLCYITGRIELWKKK